jgi:beta-lactamase superfamily II metal-dependent hydrolase
MTFEIDFHAVGDGAHSGDAISLRYFDGSRWVVGVIDGGYEATGEAIRDHIREVYNANAIDFVVSTHPDNDHASGLRVLLTDMRVGQLWTHLPWKHAARMSHLFASRRWTVAGLEQELKRSYGLMSELVDLAIAQGTELKAAFAGARVGPFVILSPSIEMYEGLLPQFRDTPQPDASAIRALGHWLEGVGRRISRTISMVVSEDWSTETLLEGGSTAAENESSVVLAGDLGNGTLLFTGDAGLKALSAAIAYSRVAGIRLTPLRLFQVPHHGSRNNISPSMLNQLIGPIVPPGVKHGAWCVISAGKEDVHHPRQVVLNALCRRGLSPVSTKAGLIRVYHNLPARNGMSVAAPLQFSNRVEAYD